MPKHTVRSIAIIVLLSLAASGTASARVAAVRRPSPLARLLLFIHSRLGPPVGTPAPDPVTATETDSLRTAQPKS